MRLAEALPKRLESAKRGIPGIALNDQSAVNIEFVALFRLIQVFPYQRTEVLPSAGDPNNCTIPTLGVRSA